MNTATAFELDTTPELEVSTEIEGAAEVPAPASSHIKLVDAPYISEINRPIATVFLVLDAQGQAVGEPLEDMCSALERSRQAGDGSAVIRGDDGAVLALIAPVGATAERIEARGRELFAKFKRL
jgi:hypothetical protein